MISIVFNTINRYDLLKKCTDQNIKHIGIPKGEFSLAICDNGSTDPRVVTYNKSKVHEVGKGFVISNKENLGNAQMLNKLIYKSVQLYNSDYVAVIGNDIAMPVNWASRMKEALDSVPNAGICGIHCVASFPSTIQTYAGIGIRPANRVFGSWLMRRAVIDSVGYFCEDYGVYGLWDSDYNHRTQKAGFKNFYLDGAKSFHLGDDTSGNKSDYRIMKDNSLKQNSHKLKENLQKYDNGKPFYVGYNNGVIDPLLVRKNQ